MSQTRTSQLFKVCCGLDVRDPTHTKSCPIREDEDFTQWMDPRRVNKVCCGLDTRDLGHQRDCPTLTDETRQSCCGAYAEDNRHLKGCYESSKNYDKRGKTDKRNRVRRKQLCKCRTSQGAFKRAYEDYTEARFDAAMLVIREGREHTGFYECPTQENIWHVTSHVKTKV